MNQLEQQLADLLLETAIKRIDDSCTVSGLVLTYKTLIDASRNLQLAKGVPLWASGPACDQTVTCSKLDNLSDVVEASGVNTEGDPIPTPEAEKPKRTRRTKEQIAADEAAAAVGNTPVISDEELARSTAEPEAEEVQIDDVQPAEPKITHGKVQELFTLKLNNIAKAKGDVAGFKARIREVLAEMGSSAGISKLPEANLAAFHAKLVNLV